MVSEARRTEPTGIPSRIALDTSCVINLLSPEEEPDPDLLKIVRLGTEGRARLMVTPVVEDEIPDSSESDASTQKESSRRFIRKHLEIFAEDEISAQRKSERDELGKQFHQLLWPNSQQGSRTWRHGRRDCLHLASLKLCGGGVFVTLDSNLQRKAQKHVEALGCSVVLPTELMQALPKPKPIDVARLDAVVRRAKQDDADAVAELMDPIRSSYPNFDDWRSKALSRKEAYVGIFDGRIAGISVWSPKDERVVKLSTFYVGDDYQRKGLGPHLLFHQLRLWIAQRFEKVFVTVSSERLPALEFFLRYGFRVEGASTRRYKAGATEFILSKHLFYQQIDDDGLDPFLERISDEVFALPDDDIVQRPAHWFMPPCQRRLRAIRDRAGRVHFVGIFEDDRQVGHMPLSELEEVTYPARLAVDGREAFMIPIKPGWADALMEVPRLQGSLFPNTDKLRLRTDNAYYCNPRIGPKRLKDSPVLFYVSEDDKLVAGFARILNCRIAPPEDLFVEFGDIGVYSLDNIRGHVPTTVGGQYAGCAMALKFAWWVPFERPVDLNRLRSEFGLEHPQSVMSLPYDTYVKILKAGGINW